MPLRTSTVLVDPSATSSSRSGEASYTFVTLPSDGSIRTTVSVVQTLA